MRQALSTLSLIESLVHPGGLKASHVAALEALSESEPLSNGAIARALGSSAATTTRCLDKLVSLGMVRASLDVHDRRRNAYRLEMRAQSILFEIRRALPEGGCLDNPLKLHRIITYQAGKPLFVGEGSQSVVLSSAALRLVIAASNEGTPVSDVAKRAGLHDSTASMAIKALIGENLVAYEENKEEPDKRKHLVFLTSDGEKVARYLLKQFQN